MRGITFLISWLALFSSCNNDSTSTSTRVVGDEQRYSIIHESKDNQLSWGYDSVYNTTVNGVTKYQQQRTETNDQALKSTIASWEWSQGDSPLADRGYPYRQQLIWSYQHVVTPQEGEEATERNLASYSIALLMPQPLSYDRTAPVFQAVFEQLNQQLPFPTSDLPDFSNIAPPDFVLQFQLDKQPDVGAYRTRYTTSADFNDQVVWLPQDSLFLPINIQIQTTTTFRNLPATIITESTRPIPAHL